MAQKHGRAIHPQERGYLVALELYMVGLIVRDMAAAVAFYRHLGVAIPPGSEERRFVEIKMTGMSLFLDATASAWDPDYVSRPEARIAAEAGKHGHLLEFKLPNRRAVDELYDTLTRLGYHTYRDPYEVAANAYFALVFDPDGNM